MPEQNSINIIVVIVVVIRFFINVMISHNVIVLLNCESYLELLNSKRHLLVFYIE